ncbi:hypothetical protein FAF44_33635 [Nonomuraea sp. MG754425]|uniref:hypothetical protein n=1 Tax=Nonomuraea sp. MG754425 TaxID=2570319 RepID=UPI001F18C675|nr:hypothetical protein [Nonomuraea sp. MG754425]MCF6473291.1 hypothetical protein [Nonomuraea sp. MG754425]
MENIHRKNSALVLYAGLALSVLVTLVPLLDLVTADSLTGHVRAAYPDWPPELVAADHDAIVSYLTVAGVLGVAGWLWTIRAAAGGRRVRALATTLFSLGACVALVNLTLSGGAYDRVVPVLYGTLWLLPVVAGAVVVARAWRRAA